MTHISHSPRPDLLAPVRRWVDGIQVHDRQVAHLICQVIPCHCVFERNITLLGRTYHIPPLCKLNPIYDELVYLRLRALTYLAEVCQEDVNHYIC
ncbi:nitrogenase [Leptolyngbya sp. 'hensonii']|uniref:Mo-dependent nitrogenase C-terminal domain-containing protein n=1 Tax=Leptolyngbya sp. 'hensonii' TaxID=1922337 RepID=UPI00094F5C83|nr:Mo-dependent nitrogenase C-terminal domain-containing protein [Leptolyngbya sp. 'hensonii']OLP16674.1 nitrogenase [Leptolyngbya sp. 'hensonii']